MKDFFDKILRGKLTYKNISAVHIIMTLVACFIGIITVWLFGDSDTTAKLALLAMFVFYALGFLLKRLYWRCPHCEASFPRRFTRDQLAQCPGCKKEIEWK